MKASVDIDKQTQDIEREVLLNFTSDKKTEVVANFLRLIEYAKAKPAPPYYISNLSLVLRPHMSF